MRIQIDAFCYTDKMCNNAVYKARLLNYLSCISHTTIAMNSSAQQLGLPQTVEDLQQLQKDVQAYEAQQPGKLPAHA